MEIRSSSFHFWFWLTSYFPIKHSKGRTFGKCWVNKVRDFFPEASVEFLRVFNVLKGSASLQEWDVVCSASQTYLTEQSSVVEVRWNDGPQTRFARFRVKTFLQALSVVALFSLPSCTGRRRWSYSLPFPLGHCWSASHLFVSVPFSAAVLLSSVSWGLLCSWILLKHLIRYFSPSPSSAVNLRGLYFCIDDIFAPLFLAPQPPLTLLVFSFSPSATPKITFPQILALLPRSACNLCASISPGTSPALNWYLVLSRTSHSLLPCLFSSMCCTVFSESHFYCFQCDFHVCDTLHPSEFLSANSLFKK